jgi:hypothetical protein
MRNDTRAIFHQLAALPGDGNAGVKCIIENHDAWVNSDEVQAAPALRQQVARRDLARSTRIEAQRTRLQSLVTVLRHRVASAG